MISLLPFDPDDAPSWAAMLARMDPWARLGFSAQSLARYLACPDPALQIMVARDDKDGPAGIIGLRNPWLRGPYIETLAVLTPFQGGGVGTRLIKWAVGESRCNLWVCVSAFNDKAQGFYRSQGFVPVGTMPDLVAEGFDEILMRRRLPPSGEE